MRSTAGDNSRGVVNEAEEKEKEKAKKMKKRIVNISKEPTISLILRKLLKLLSWGLM